MLEIENNIAMAWIEVILAGDLSVEESWFPPLACCKLWTSCFARIYNSLNFFHYAQYLTVITSKQACRSDEIRNCHRRNYFVTERNSPSSYFKKYLYTSRENLCHIRAERKLTNYNHSYVSSLLLFYTFKKTWSYLCRFVCLGKSPKYARQSAEYCTNAEKNWAGIRNSATGKA